MTGHLSRSRGKTFEDELALLHQHYHNHDLALVRHNGTQAEKKGDKWHPIKSQPDYTGLITCLGARHVSFDAKYRTSVSYHHPKDSLHQTQTLWENKQAGGIAFLLVVVEPYIDTPPKAFALWPQDYWQEYHGKGWTVQLTGVLNHLLGARIPNWPAVAHGFIPDWLQLFR